MGGLIGGFATALGAHTEEIVTALVALGLLYARALVQARVARLGVEQAQEVQASGPERKALAVARVKALPIGIRPLSGPAMESLVQRQHEQAKKRRSTRPPPA